jgi:hypothetical protein
MILQVSPADGRMCAGIELQMNHGNSMEVCSAKQLEDLLSAKGSERAYCEEQQEGLLSPLHT